MSSVSFIDSLPADKHALHDIRFRFKVDSIWTVIITNHPELKPNDVSANDIFDNDDILVTASNQPEIISNFIDKGPGIIAEAVTAITAVISVEFENTTNNMSYHD